MLTIFSRIKMNGKQVAVMVVFVAIASVLQMLPSGMLSVMIDDGVSGGNADIIIVLAIAMIVLSIVSCATNIVGFNVAAKLIAKFSADLRREVFHKVESFSAAEIDKFGSSSLITRSTTDVSTIQTFIATLFRLGLMTPITLVAGLVMCIMSAGQISFVLAIAIPILVLGVALLTVAAGNYSTKLRDKIDKINQLFLEALEGVRVIRAFNKQQHEIDRFGELNAETAEVSRMSTTLSGEMYPTATTLFGLTTAGVIAAGVYYVVTGEMAVGTLVSATQYITQIMLAIILMANVISLFPDAYACMKRIADVLETEVSIVDAQGDTPERTSSGTVEFRDVTFAYPGADEPVIKHVSFVSAPGETTAIIGRTGCGKSSVVKLIPRLYDVTFGDVLVDGVSVKDYKLDELRDIIGYVPQKNVLFSGDIASNLNFGKEDGSDEDWAEACRISCASEFVEQKEGTYHAEVAQGGTNFSGGQRQRLAIARAVMKKPEVYIFDDSFSALDMKTDKQLRANLKESMGDATMIVVAQRVNTIMDATRILVLENGEVTGMGTHLELLKTCQLYREIAEIQLGEEEVQHELANA